MSSQLSFTFYGQMGKYRAYRYANGVWYADYRAEGGKRMRVSLEVKRKPDAERALRTFDERRASERAIASTPEAARPHAPLIVDIVDLFMKWCEARRLAPKSLSRYRAATAAFLRYCGKIGVSQADELTLAMLEAFLAYRIDDEECEEKTAYNDAIILKGLFKFAGHPERHLLTKDISAGWELREPPKKQAYCFTQTEVDTLVTGCREWLRPVVLTLAYEGCRIGELANLRPADVDLDGGFIHVRCRDDWSPKGREDRAVPINDVVRGVLATRLDGQWVFGGARGRKLRENHTLEALKTDRARLGIHRGTLHSLRHFFVSLCAERGVPLLTCMKWVGHKDAETVQRYYHLHDDASRRAMERMAVVVGPVGQLSKMA